MGAVVSLLWPKNSAVLHEYLRRVPSAVHTPETLLGSVAPSVAASAAVLAGEKASQARAALGSDPRSAAVATRIRESFSESLLLVDALDGLHASEGVELVVLNEDVTQRGKTVAKWAAARSVPSVVLSHSCILGRLYTVHRDVSAETIAVFGSRGAQPYIESGIEPARVSITGNPAWDTYRGLIPRRAAIRAELSRKHGFSPNDHVVVFATTWPAFFTAFCDPGHYEDSVRAVLRAVRELRELDVPLQLVIKERPSNAGKRAQLDALIREEATGFTPLISDGDLELWTVASDAVISVDSNVAIEASLAGTVAINLWSPMSWLNGPFFDASDGVLETTADKLSLAIAHALGNEEMRKLLRSQAAARVSDFAAAPGEAVARMAALMEQKRKPAPVDVRYVWQELSNPKPVSDKGKDSVYYRSPRTDMLAHLRSAPKFVLDVGCGAGATGAEIKQRYPNAYVTGIELNEGAARLAADRLDRVIQHNVEQLDFEKAGFTAGSIDLVLFPDVLEHLYDPWNVLMRIRRFLAPGAQVLASIPNSRNLWLLSHLSGGGWDYAEDGLLDVTHIRFFTKKTIAELFAQTGYDIHAMYSNPDGRVPVMQAPDGGDVNIDTPQFTLKNLNAQDLVELRTLQFIVDAAPQPHR